MSGAVSFFWVVVLLLSSPFSCFPFRLGFLLLEELWRRGTLFQVFWVKGGPGPRFLRHRRRHGRRLLPSLFRRQYSWERCNLIFGFLQMAQRPGSTLRFYDVTNPKEAVGLFANRNHFAAHLYVTLVLAA